MPEFYHPPLQRVKFCQCLCEGAQAMDAQRVARGLTGWFTGWLSGHLPGICAPTPSYGSFSCGSMGHRGWVPLGPGRTEIVCFTLQEGMQVVGDGHLGVSAEWTLCAPCACRFTKSNDPFLAHVV